VLIGGRDEEAYRNKGKRRNSIKTIYGEVEYERYVYKSLKMARQHISTFWIKRYPWLIGHG